jgi:hypothetical protein
MLAIIAGMVYNFTLMFAVLTACAHLRDISDYAQELVSITYHVSEIRRRLAAIERRMA